MRLQNGVLGTEDYSVSFVLAALIEKAFPDKYAERSEEDIVEEEERKKAVKERNEAVTARLPIQESGCDFQWPATSFLSECLGRGCFLMD